MGFLWGLGEIWWRNELDAEIGKWVEENEVIWVALMGVPKFGT